MLHTRAGVQTPVDIARSLELHDSARLDTAVDEPVEALLVLAVAAAYLAIAIQRRSLVFDSHLDPLSKLVRQLGLSFDGETLVLVSLGVHARADEVRRAHSRGHEGEGGEDGSEGGEHHGCWWWSWGRC